MKKEWSMFLVVTLVVIAGVYVFMNVKHKNRLKSEGIFATTNAGVVTEDEINSYIKTLELTLGKKVDMQSLKTEDKKALVSDIINNRIMIQKAKSSDVVNSKEFKKGLADRKDKLALELYLKDLIAKNITENDIKIKYDELVNSLKDKEEYRVSHILTENEDSIKKAVEELKSISFADAVKKYSIDTTTKENGGEIGWLMEGQMMKEFDEVMKSQAINRISKPFKTQLGWHVIIVKEKRKAVLPEFDKAKDAVKAVLIRDMIKSYSNKNVNDLNIEIVQ